MTAADVCWRTRYISDYTITNMPVPFTQQASLSAARHVLGHGFVMLSCKHSVHVVPAGALKGAPSQDAMLLTDHNGSLHAAQHQHRHQRKATDAQPHGRQVHALALQPSTGVITYVDTVTIVEGWGR
jgi:hypothetical protein